MKKPSPILSAQRNARLVAWGRLMLAWVGALMFSTTLGKISERHLLARMYYTNLDRVAATIANIVLLHAFAKLCHPSSGGTPFKLRDYTGAGFALRTQVRNILRAGQGVWRRRLNRRNLLTRLGLIVQALNDIDTLAARAAPRRAHAGHAPSARRRQLLIGPPAPSPASFRQIQTAPSQAPRGPKSCAFTCAPKS